MRLLAAAVAALCVLTFAARAQADQRWLVVSDIHLDPYDRSAFPSGWGLDSNLALMDSAISQMQRVDPSPAVVVLAGDFLAHHFPRRAHSAGMSAQAGAIDATRTIVRHFDRAFPHAAFIITLGNNDDYCGDYRSDAGGSYQRALEKLWAPLIDRDGSRTTFATSFIHGGYYSVDRAQPRLRVLVLNDVPWSLFYQGSCKSGADIATAERAWLKRTSHESGPAIIIGHIPPGIDARSSEDLHGLLALPFLKPADERALEAALERNSIQWALFGHVHRNDFRIIGRTPALIVSSISPIYDNNPSFYVLDIAAGGELQDIQTTIFDEMQGRWRGVESFDREFGVARFDLAALLAIHQRIASDPSYRARWAARYVSYSEGASENRDGTSLQYAWCGQQLGFAHFLHCAPSHARTTLAHISFIVAIVLVLMMTVVILGLRMRESRPHR